MTVSQGSLTNGDRAAEHTLDPNAQLQPNPTATTTAPERSLEESLDLPEDKGVERSDEFMATVQGMTAEIARGNVLYSTLTSDSVEASRDLAKKETALEDAKRSLAAMDKENKEIQTFLAGLPTLPPPKPAPSDSQKDPRGSSDQGHGHGSERADGAAQSLDWRNMYSKHFEDNKKLKDNMGKNLKELRVRQSAQSLVVAQRKSESDAASKKLVSLENACEAQHRHNEDYITKTKTMPGTLQALVRVWSKMQASVVERNNSSSDLLAAEADELG